MSTLPLSPTVTLNDGIAIPQLGFGTWELQGQSAYEMVRHALDIGVRHLDTAMIYENEPEVGKAIRDSGIARDELFITTKLWNDNQDAPIPAMDASLQRLGLDYVDLYLMHWPCPAQDRYLPAWEAMIGLREAQKTRSIGVSNFLPEHLERITTGTGVRPVLNQIEIHPYFAQKDLRAYHDANDIYTESWSPLGRQGELTDPGIVGIAQQLGVTPAQVILRWHLQHNIIVFPRSSQQARVTENFDILGFHLDVAALEAIDALDKGERVGPHPNDF